ncbi:MAG: DUF1343 domain-containing protein [Saprospiraceae bacterium]|nr:DUF1343 domain-containing protein [Saprospiraceae bacterium]
MVSTLRFAFLMGLCWMACLSSTPKHSSPVNRVKNQEGIEAIPGAYSIPLYIDLLKNKRVGLVVNQTSMIGQVHLVDTLLKHHINITKIFSPEHGFRGEADAGEKVATMRDPETGIMLVSLYGEKRKPGPEDLADLDIVVFDIQDIGVRFYTYIASLSLLMEACGENQKPLILLDRPSPNGYYVDGPVMKKGFTSFLGFFPVPVVYGLTIGEYAMMVNGERWNANGVQCDLQVIPCTHYDHTMTYDLPVKPSPNIPNLRATLLYPSTCFFEGTTSNEGRGTELPFICFGHPKYSKGDYQYTPRSIPGAKTPKLLDQLCYGHNLSNLSIEEIRSWKRLNLKWLLMFYADLKDKDPFFLQNNFLNKLAGNDQLMAQIKAGLSEEEIRASWQADLAVYNKIRAKYLLYKDFK